MMDIKTYMTPRLLCIASFVDEGCTVADIGTDHAYIPIWLVQKGIAKQAIAMDISKGPIARAEENIQKFSVQDTVKTRLSDGLKKLCPHEADTVIIAGMGGMLINEILENSKALLPHIRRFILQPMTAIEETRKYLSANGFYIEDERLAQEEDKVYCVLSVTHGDMKVAQEIDYYIGTKLVENRDPLLITYLNGKIYECDKAITSLQSADKEKTAERLSHFVYLSTEMKRLREECAQW